MAVLSICQSVSHTDCAETAIHKLRLFTVQRSLHVHFICLILITLLHTLSIPPITTTVITPTLYLYHSTLKMNLFQKFLPTIDLALLIGLPSRTRDHGMVLGFFFVILLVRCRL